MKLLFVYAVVVFGVCAVNSVYASSDGSYVVFSDDEAGSDLSDSSGRNNIEIPRSRDVNYQLPESEDIGCCCGGRCGNRKLSKRPTGIFEAESVFDLQPDLRCILHRPKR